MRDEFILLRRGERPRFQQPVERRGGGVVATSTSSIGGIAPSDGLAGGSEIVELQPHGLPELGEGVSLPGGVASLGESAAAQGMAVPGIRSWPIVPRTGSGASGSFLAPARERVRRMSWLLAHEVTSPLGKPGAALQSRPQMVNGMASTARCSPATI
ncbi:MAG: hypothetical protein DI619_05675 [Francisella sp.]|nr:MAG: hypothetical protein DI619_05675 [Francisella sp.]